jgi:hypothetical protein
MITKDRPRKEKPKVMMKTRFKDTGVMQNPYIPKKK